MKLIANMFCRRRLKLQTRVKRWILKRLRRHGVYMNKTALLISVLIISLMVAGNAGAGTDRRRMVPRVTYMTPDNDSLVDLNENDAITFSWKSLPIPAGGREAFRFRVYKGFSYTQVVAKDLERDVFSVEVPAGNFEDGILYSWHVQQRDAANMTWSLYDTWSFKVSKKK